MASGTEHRFDADTRVEPAGEGRFDARIDRAWWIVDGPNGGYIAAILLRALTRAVDDPERAPRSLTVHYTARPAEGAARVETRVERRGRSLTTVAARLLQGDRLLALALAAFSKPWPGLEFRDIRMPEAPPPERCGREREVRVPNHAQYEMRWALGSRPFSGGEAARCGAWVRPAEPRVVDPPLVAAYCDALPPAIFSRAIDRDLRGGVPTIDLTVHFREPTPLEGARPDDFCLALFQSRMASGGFLEEDGEIWSRDGRLLAQSRQLALAR